MVSASIEEQQPACDIEARAAEPESCPKKDLPASLHIEAPDKLPETAAATYMAPGPITVTPISSPARR